LQSSLAFDIGSGPDSFTIADLNADHLPDVITANLNDNTVSVLLNQSASTGADLSLRMVANPEPVSITQPLTYTVELINAGPQDATNVVLTDTLPGNVTFGAVNITQGTCSESQLVVTCAISNLVSGDHAFTTIKVTPGTVGQVMNSASVTASESDPAQASNTVSHSTRVDPMFKLTITKSGAGSGTVITNGDPNAINCGSSCTASLPTGTPVNLQVSPEPGSGFGGWGGACAVNGTAPGCNVTMSSDVSVSATFDTLPNFVMTLDSTSLTLSRGGTASAGLTIIPEGSSFDSAIALTCEVAGTAPAPSCTVSPSSITPGANPITAILTFNSANMASLNMQKNAFGVTLIYAFSLVLSGIVLTGLGARSGKRNFWLPLLTVMVFSLLLSACGGSGTSQQEFKSPQNFVATVSAVSGNVQHSTQLTLVVQ
jgi:uncharacterized repeat protein (TIGR01451 family)